MNITEDYVSFEVAKLLKEKGFDIPCNCYGAYNGVNLTYKFCLTDKYTDWNKHFGKTIISCPTLQMAMKWLREVHNRFVEVCADKGYDFKSIVFRPAVYDKDLDCLWELDNYKSYEEACEAAIRYCLTNLI